MSKIVTFVFSFVVLAVPTLFTTACNDYPGNPQTHTSSATQSELFSYRIVRNGYDSRPRMAVSRDQYCRNLQSRSANANFQEIASALKDKFDSACEGREWNPNATDIAIQATPGPHVNCFVSQDNPTIDQLVVGEKYVNQQYTTDPLTVIPHDDFLAVVTQEMKNGRFTLHIRLMTSYPNGATIADGEKVSQDKAPDSLQVDGTSGTIHARATCWPSLH